MLRAIRYAQNYLLYILPFVLVCMAWGSVTPEREILKNPTLLTKVLWEALSWNLIAWFVVLILFLVALVLSPTTRERTLTRLANIKERDEREHQITGRAARTAYISTLSLLILLLFFSIFSLNIYRAPVSEAVQGKTGKITIGLHFNLLDTPREERDPIAGEVLFESRDLPLSKSALLLLVLIWQLAAFGFTARREDLRALEG